MRRLIFSSQMRLVFFFGVYLGHAAMPEMTDLRSKVRQVVNHMNSFPEADLERLRRIYQGGPELEAVWQLRTMRKDVSDHLQWMPRPERHLHAASSTIAQLGYGIYQPSRLSLWLNTCLKRFENTRCPSTITDSHGVEYYYVPDNIWYGLLHGPIVDIVTAVSDILAQPGSPDMVETMWTRDRIDRTINELERLLVLGGYEVNEAREYIDEMTVVPTWFHVALVDYRRDSTGVHLVRKIEQHRPRRTNLPFYGNALMYKLAWSWINNCVDPLLAGDRNACSPIESERYSLSILGRDAVIRDRITELHRIGIPGVQDMALEEAKEMKDFIEFIFE